MATNPTIESFSQAWMELLDSFRKAKAIDTEHAPDFGVGSISVLQKIAEGAVTAKEISHRTGMSAPSVARAVEALSVADLIEREHSKEDRRIINLRLTDTGQIFITGRCRWMNDHVQHLFDELSEEERAMAMKLLPRMSEVMRSW